MIDDLGFNVEVLFTSSLKFNARNVEDALQRMFQYLPLGHRRLWRFPDRGAKCELPDGSVHSVGIAYSTEVIPVIEKGWIEICE
mmetsp:Transcript_21646/g.26562  ORF Transcript_21646/g.26562 Transcript_21646/m.26562 type:complete len:84 (+) Transcript_21646:610-861(+)